MGTSPFHEFEARDLDGRLHRFDEFLGRVVLVVNTASECGYTPQLEGLEVLWRRYRERGLVVVGFPSNEFGGQEPGTDAQIGAFCRREYGVSFPVMSKIHVNGAEAHPLYRWLKEQAPGLLGIQAIKWNFTKFLVGRDGRVIRRYAPGDTPARIEPEIEAALDNPPST